MVVKTELKETKKWGSNQSEESENEKTVSPVLPCLDAMKECKILVVTQRKSRRNNKKCAW